MKNTETLFVEFNSAMNSSNSMSSTSETLNGNIYSTEVSFIQLLFFVRYDGVGDTYSKVDPVLKKHLSINELGIIVLFAAANGDVLALRR